MLELQEVDQVVLLGSWTLATVVSRCSADLSGHLSSRLLVSRRMTLGCIPRPSGDFSCLLNF